MFKFKQYNFKNFNFTLIVIVSILTLISTYAIKLSGATFFSRQLIGLVLGLIVVAIVSLVDYHFICQLIVFFYVGIIGLLALVKFSPLGTDHGTGAFRWIDLKVIELQPSELAKIVLILVLAVLFDRLVDRMDKFTTVVIAAIIMAIPTALIFIQTDLSSSMVMVFIFVIMIFAAGLSYRIIVPIVAVSVPTLIGLFWYIQQPGQKLIEQYQVNRILGFRNPEKFEQTITWQQQKSIEAIANGQLYGKLLAEGPSNVRGYNSVGVNESDFIWSVIGEEFGFIGGCIIIFLLFMIVIFCLKTAKKAKDRLGQLIAIGISANLIFQIFANIGVATMILPNTGLPLPFISYGLTSLIGCMIAIGLIINIGLQQKQR